MAVKARRVRSRSVGRDGSKRRLSPLMMLRSPFAEFYAELLAKGMRQEMARLTLARKIATIVLIVWKRGVSFDAQHLKPQTA